MEARLAVEELLKPGKHDMPGQLTRLANFLGWGAVPKHADAVRIGILGASQVATYALIWPAKRRPDVVVAAVAARDAARAAQYAAKHNIPASYGSYQELLSDPSLAAIYVATPNGLHGEWAAAALRAGKHVLCEKPFTANAAEARAVQQAAARRGLLCREAFHYKEHPANKAVARLLQSGAIGQVSSLEARVCIPAFLFNKNDIRFKYALAGGTAMDAGCYCAHSLRFFSGCSQPQVTSAAASKLLDGGLIDGCISATLSYPGGSSGADGSALAAGAVGRLQADLRHPGLWPSTLFAATGTKGRLHLNNFIMPVMGHTITLTRMVTDAASSDNPDTQRGALGDGLKEVTHRLSIYGSGECGGESNYFHQLARFVSDLKVLDDRGAPKEAKRAVRRAMKDDAADAIDNMTLVDAIYTAARLPLRQPTGALLAAAASA